jgi:hypothetical protein
MQNLLSYITKILHKGRLVNHLKTGFLKKYLRHYLGEKWEKRD